MFGTVHDSEVPVSLTSCPLCGSRSLRRLAVPGHWINPSVFDARTKGFGLTRCVQCTFRFVNPRPSRAHLDRFYGGQEYDCHRATSATDIPDRARFLLDRIAQYVPRAPRCKLLDFGCGSGYLLKHASAAGWDAVGFDIGAAAIESCRRQNLRAERDLDRLAGTQFDAIVFNQVFEHIEEPGTALTGAARLLSRKGKIFVVVPNAASLRAQLSAPLLSRHFGFDERYRAFPIHLSYFTPTTLRTILRKHGFRADQVENFGIGLDELFLTEDDESGSPTEAPAPAPAGAGVARGLPMALAQKGARLLKNTVKDWLFGNGLGEYLMAVASAAPAARQEGVRATSSAKS
jgi:2-polyprenyl-3-methyl-5-hydroxy-6-metoxy-1,4-benzoquinol methylase